MVTYTIRNSEESLDFHSYAVSKNPTIHSRAEVKTLKINKKETHLEPSQIFKIQLFTKIVTSKNHYHFRKEFFVRCLTSF